MATVESAFDALSGQQSDWLQIPYPGHNQEARRRCPMPQRRRHRQFGEQPGEKSRGLALF